MRMVNLLSIGGRVNTIGVVASLMLLYACFSNNPWWILTGGQGGENIILVEISPFTFHMEILRRPVVIPIIPYLNLIAKLTLTLAAIMMLIGSAVPEKPWSKPLMGLSGIFIPMIFLAGLLISLRMAENYFKVNIPINGICSINYTVENIRVQILLRSFLTTEYYIAILVGVLSVLAKILHGRIQTKHG